MANIARDESPAESSVSTIEIVLEKRHDILTRSISNRGNIESRAVLRRETSTHTLFFLECREIPVF
jgi:hypothetical protein